LSAKEIAEELDELNTDDADIIAELSQSKKEEVISELDDLEHAKDDLLRYDEDSAGGLMGKSLLKSTKMERAYLCVKKCVHRPKMYLEYTLFM
jgi:magnesium transporter